MKVERKAITVQVQVQVLAKMKAIQEELGLSQAKLIEMLIENYNPQVNLQAKPQVLAEVQAKPQVEIQAIKEEILAEVQALVQAQVSQAIKQHLNTTAGASTSTSTSTSTCDEDDEDEDEDGLFIDESPPLKMPTMEQFYGKVPPSYEEQNKDVPETDIWRKIKEQEKEWEESTKHFIR